MNFHKKVAPAFYRYIMLFDRDDYQSLSRDIREADWESLKSNDIDIYASNITNRISKLADKHIPNKKVKIRQSDPSWLTNTLETTKKKTVCVIGPDIFLRNEFDFWNEYFGSLAKLVKPEGRASLTLPET